MSKKKMYVLVRNDLETTYRCVQGGHALAQFALENPEELIEWNNETIVFLACRGIDELLNYHIKAMDRCLPVSSFEEPDLNNQLTGIACYCDGRLFKKLPLAR